MNYQVQTTPSVGLVEAVKLLRRNFINFEGRARRSEYWMAKLALCLVCIAAVFVAMALGAVAVALDVIAIIYLLMIVASVGILFCFVALLSLSVRRLHDTGKSGWWYLLRLTGFGSIVLLVFYCLDSTEDNQWGPNPKIVRSAAPSYTPAAPAYVPPAPAAIPPVQEETVYEATYTPAQIPSTSAVPPVKPAAPVNPAPQLYAVLQMQTGTMAGKSVRIPAGRTVTVGRNPSASDLALSGYNVVSGTHCKIAFGNRTITIMDMNSTNGTFVNGNRLTPGKPVTVQEGATVQLGNNTCVFRLRFE